MMMTKSSSKNEATTWNEDGRANHNRGTFHSICPFIMGLAMDDKQAVVILAEKKASQRERERDKSCQCSSSSASSCSS